MTNKQNPGAVGAAAGGNNRGRLYALAADCSSGAVNTETAFDLAQRGLPVFPCRADKRPITENGFHDATTDAETIRQWWQQ